MKAIASQQLWIVYRISRYKHGDPDGLDYQRQIIDTFVNRIYVYDDRLVLTYNYKDGTESITLEDIQKAFGSDLSSIAPRKNRFQKGSGFLRGA
ncbi:MAG: hypothetical protein Q4G19_04630 [Clostridia bacterium]|nr:hypothetical protein [Clostridia bacterium]